MQIRERAAGAVRILDLEGDLCIGEGDLALREAVRELTERGGASIVLDLRGVTRIDSAGLGEIIACTKRARDRGGDVKLLAPSKKALESLVVGRLTEVLNVYQDESAALASF